MYYIIKINPFVNSMTSENGYRCPKMGTYTLHLLALIATGRDVRVMLAIVTFSERLFLLSIVLTSTATSDCMLVTSAMG